MWADDVDSEAVSERVNTIAGKLDELGLAGSSSSSVGPHGAPAQETRGSDRANSRGGAVATASACRPAESTVHQGRGFRLHPRGGVAAAFSPRGPPSFKKSKALKFKFHSQFSPAVDPVGAPTASSSVGLTDPNPEGATKDYSVRLANPILESSSSSGSVASNGASSSASKSRFLWGELQ